jgi:hypothetical protein
MRKGITVALASAALCIPSIGFANHSNGGTSWMDETFETEEMCEDAIADERKRQAEAMNLKGRDKGQFNKRFNAQFDCEEIDDTDGDDDDTDFHIVDNHHSS